VLSDNGGNLPLTVSGTGDLIVSGGLSLAQTGGGVVVSNNAVRLGGQLFVGYSAPGFSPGEVEFFGRGGQRVPYTGGAYQAMTITGDSVVFSDTGATLTGDLTIRGNGLAHFYGGIGSLTVGGGLTTQDAGALRMDGANYPNLTVSGDVVFGGGSTADRLISGYLQIGGNFTQLGTTSFQASVGHMTVFSNSLVEQTVSFEAPDTLSEGSGTHSGSHFGDMRTEGSVVVQLLTDAVVQGTFSKGEIGGATLTGDYTLFTRGLNWSNSLTIDGTLLVLLDGQSVSFGSTTFRNQPPAATQFWIRRSETCLYFYGLNFQTVPGTDGHYVGVENLSGSSQSIYFGSGSPASLEPYVQSIGSPIINYTYGSCGPF
jgi:hypothetical protein